MITKREWWTVFMYGDCETICSKHKSAEAAFKAAVKCEKRGGADHRILEVIEAVPYKRGRR